MTMCVINVLKIEIFDFLKKISDYFKMLKECHEDTR